MQAYIEPALFGLNRNERAEIINRPMMEARAKLDEIRHDEALRNGTWFQIKHANRYGSY